MTSVQAKLLVLLVVLSLPLLVVSLFQLGDQDREAIEDAATVADLQSSTVAVTLDDWFDDNANALAVSPDSDAARDLYARVYQNTLPASNTVIIVSDAEGNSVPNPFLLNHLSPPSSFTGVNPAGERSTEQQRWSDNVTRLTSLRRLEPSGWSVAVGVPAAKGTSGGRSALWLTATWALALAASILLAIWAVGRFTTPLRRLAASASMLGEGRLQERVVVETRDEVGTLAASFNDMAGRLQSKFAELHTQNAFIAEVLNTLPLGVVVLDERLIVQKANSTFAGFVGRQPEMLAGRGLYEASAGLAQLREIVEDVRRTRRPFVSYGLPLELTARKRETERDGGAFWDIVLWPTSERSSARGDLILLMSEVSKRVRAEKLATVAFASERARAAELESIIKQMNEGVVIVDSRGLYRVNPAAMTILGKRRAEFRDGVDALIEDIGLRSIADEHTLTAEENPLRGALDRGEQFISERAKIIRGDGQTRVLAVSATPLTGEAERREGMIAVLRDITEEVRQHNELVGAYERLREHDRLKSAFVANVSHELRTPLNVIIGMCQVLARDQRLPLAPLQAEAVARMDRNAHSLLSLVNDLLDYSRLEAGRSALHLESVEIAEAISEITEQHRPDARTKRIELDASALPLTVLTDRRKIAQVISNLTSNAIKFTPAGGRVTIRVALEAEDQWSLEVRDTGIGMSPDEIAFIFDEFRQADEQLARRYGGVGLGLAITRKIVELLEGTITVESVPGQGSTFRVVWPIRTRPRTGTGSLVGANETLPAKLDSIRAQSR